MVRLYAREPLPAGTLLLSAAVVRLKSTEVRLRLLAPREVRVDHARGPAGRPVADAEPESVA